MKVVLGDVKGDDLACDVVMKTRQSVMKLLERSHRLEPPQGQQTSRRMPMKACMPARTHCRHDIWATS